MRRVKKAWVSASAIPSWWSTQPSRVTLMLKVRSPMVSFLGDTSSGGVYSLGTLSQMQGQHAPLPLALDVCGRVAQGRKLVRPVCLSKPDVRGTDDDREVALNQRSALSQRLLGHPELENALNQLFLAIGGAVAEYPNEPNVDQAPERRLI